MQIETENAWYILKKELGEEDPDILRAEANVKRWNLDEYACSFPDWDLRPPAA